MTSFSKDPSDMPGGSFFSDRHPSRARLRVLHVSNDTLAEREAPLPHEEKDTPLVWGLCRFLDAFAFAMRDDVGLTGIGIAYGTEREALRAAMEQLRKLRPGCSAMFDRDDEWSTRVVRNAADGGEAVLHVRATDFQLSVWQAARSIPRGATISYARLAESIGNAAAARAVGNALATNPVALLIPCHRVLPSSGGAGSYRWGQTAKEQLLRRECVKGVLPQDRPCFAGRIVHIVSAGDERK